MELPCDINPAFARNRLMTTEEVADYLQVPTRTVEDWRLRKVGPDFVRVGKHVRYRSTELDMWIVSKETRA